MKPHCCERPRSYGHHIACLADNGCRLFRANVHLLSLTMRPRNNPEGAIFICHWIQVDSQEEHLFKQVSRGLQVRNSRFDRWFTEGG